MPILLPNILFDVHRASFIVGKGTKAAIPYLYNQEGHLMTIASRHLRMSATSAVRIVYEMHVEFGADIVIGDIITNIRLISTGDVWVDDNSKNIQTWRVIDPYDMSPGILAYKNIMMERVIGGGPAPI
jgi:hypothetical protein